MERFRPTNKLNRIKDHSEKLKHFIELFYTEALESGWNPLDENADDKLKSRSVP
ncbi:hypothetical protein [Pedobacter agri]|uniref:hypothetical protein n=1 Tax=Pedobacter agri TaxID=454586 RepID=UPI00293171D7|nr:hypothetical protein [Pedobacter agri]